LIVSITQSKISLSCNFSVGIDFIIFRYFFFREKEESTPTKPNEMSGRNP